MSKNLNNTYDYEVYGKLLSLIGISTLGDFLKLSDEDIAQKLNSVKMALSNYERIVEQNRSLQQEISLLKRYDIREMPANKVDIKYPNFNVIGYSFYHVFDSVLIIGVVKTRQHIHEETIEKMYIGIVYGSDLNRDLEHVVLYGQKIYEESIVKNLED